MQADLRPRRRTHALAGRVPEPDRRRPRAPRTRSARSTCSGSSPTDGFVTPDVVREALTDDTRALAVSLVDFRTGYRADLTALREVIGDRLLIVDAIQGFGAVEADYAAADVVCGNGYKWLRAGRGTGFAWFGERALERIAPVLSGFAGTDGDLPVDVVPLPAASAQAFTVSRPDQPRASRASRPRCATSATSASSASRRELSRAHARRHLLRRPLRGARHHPARAGAPRGHRHAGPRAAGRRRRWPRRWPTTGSPSPSARASSASRRTSAPAPTRCASSATRWRRSRPLACGDGAGASRCTEFTRP